MRTITAAVLGAGGRGMDYSAYAVDNPDEIRITAVAEPDAGRMEKYKNLHDIPEENCFKSWRELLSKPRMADTVLICMQDHMHFEPAVKALESGYHILLEKPMATSPAECLVIEKKARETGRIVLVCHVLRYTPFFTTLKELIESGRIGRLISIQHNENVAFWHQAHSFVRGSWGNTARSSPMILAKSSHDMDMMLWLAGADCKSIASFGSLTHFKKENAPEGAPAMCLDGCPAENECPFYAPKIYLTGDTGWPASAISEDTGREALKTALKTSPYGRCVYHCDNDAVDHQVVIAEFQNEVTAAFTMCGFTSNNTRTIKLMGTKGEMRCSMEKDEVEIYNFAGGSKETVCLKPVNGSHGGGDYNLMKYFVRMVQKNDGTSGLTSAAISVQSHLMAFAAEKSRLEKETINMKEYRNKLL